MHVHAKLISPSQKDKDNPLRIKTTLNSQLTALKLTVSKCCLYTCEIGLLQYALSAEFFEIPELFSYTATPIIGCKHHCEVNVQISRGTRQMQIVLRNNFQA